MPQNNKIQEKFEKTAKVAGALNLMLLSLTLADSKMYLIVSVVVNIALLGYFESLGRSRRPGSNVITKIDTFFSSSRNPDSIELQNKFRNVINGGAAVYDELNTIFMQPK